MVPAPGERVLRFVGDRIRFTLAADLPPGAGWKVLLRTNLGRAAVVRDEVISHLGVERPFAGASWRDIPMRRSGAAWELDLPLCEVGWFRAKAYAVDAHGKQHWPPGNDVGISVHPDPYRTANTIYCAFTRLFGAARTTSGEADPEVEARLAVLDAQGYTVIPPSGKLRDLTAQLPHIFGTLGCRILHLLPVNPTPTVMARYGRFGSPYACQDLTAVDPALVVHDRRTTGVDQFRELAYAAHLHGGRVFLDMVINHTGWGSTLQENRPEWFRRTPDGAFHSPGAWGNTWEDLVELDHQRVLLWRQLADAFLVWCRRGVDGFRCDAGYMVPRAAWQYITARVRCEFPDTIFLLEGLGGAYETTADLLCEGGLQWAYSELFQNYSPGEISTYLDHALAESARVGVLVHYSETHDNDRLAKRGRAWSLLRNRLCALASSNGGFGFTCGVEWLATAKIDVHHGRGLNWGAEDHLLAELGQLNRLLAEHPCFFDGARLERLSAPGDAVYALGRTSAEGLDRALVLVNTDLEQARPVVLPLAVFARFGEPVHDLLGGAPLAWRPAPGGGGVTLLLPPAACRCLGAPLVAGLGGDRYRAARGRAAWATRVLGMALPIEDIPACPWRDLADLVEAGPARFLAAVSRLAGRAPGDDLPAALRAAGADGYPQVVTWNRRDLGRVVPVPPGHWLLVEDDTPFAACLGAGDGSDPRNESAIAAAGAYIACFPPRSGASDARLTLDPYREQGRQLVGTIRFLTQDPACEPVRPQEGLALLTNGRGGMARLAVDLGAVRSKYDCLLAANLHREVPCDRQVLAKRLRLWVVADGFISSLDAANLAGFSAGPPAAWRFIANAGDGRTVEIVVEADMLDGRNTTLLRFSRPTGAPALGSDLPAAAEVRLSVRVDIEDRGYHGETRRDAASERHFAEHVHPAAGIGFAFTPAAERGLLVLADSGRYHAEAEWCTGLPHPIEASRGMAAAGDAYSPGWFDLPLGKGESVLITVSADGDTPHSAVAKRAGAARAQANAAALRAAGVSADDRFASQLAIATRAYMVRRGTGTTVIAGYPWFLDWGRDSLICARGLLAAGHREEVRELLGVFGRHEDRGTLPNFFNGEDATNRDTSDAPLWYGVVCEDAAEALGPDLYRSAVQGGGRTLADVLVGIARGYRDGTPNGIAMDPLTGLVWSPRHFTWMDTNYPAGTPREGYPVEIQVLWIRLLRQLARLRLPADGEPWGRLAERATAAFEQLYWLEQRGCYADLLLAPAGLSAEAAVADQALRSNALFAVSLGLAHGVRAQRTVQAALRHLVVPGALRSLAPLPVTPPLPILGPDGRLLNDPEHPYWGTYAGDEDTRRKPAYHNGTAWTWTFPVFCESLARAWDFSPEAVAAARAYLGSMDRLLAEGCLGHLPEIVDGDAPHAQRGCDAQAWGATEALRVWKLLGDGSGEPGPAARAAQARATARPRRAAAKKKPAR